MRIVYIVVYMLLCLGLVSANADQRTIPQIPQNPNMPRGLMVAEFVSKPIQNLIRSDAWELTYGEQSNCTIEQINGVITMTRHSADGPPCGVNQIFAPSKGKFMITAELVENTKLAETYTEPDGSQFLPGRVLVVRTITGNRVWLQTYSDTGFPSTTTWRNIVVREIN